MGSVSGRRKGLSLPRRFICDLMRVSREMPIISLERRADLSPLIAARQQLDRPPAWALLFAKAFALVAARCPELRRAYIPLPWAHYWEADESIVSVALERDFEGEPAVFFGMATAPDKTPLSELVAKLEEWKTLPVREVSPFRRMLRFAALPSLLRRCLWWYATSWSGKIKARNFGTFGISLTGASGGTATNLICPLTTSLNTGVIQPDGTVELRLHFDHRVLDGMPAARALAELEEVLRTAITSELEAMAAATKRNIQSTTAG